MSSINSDIIFAFVFVHIPSKMSTNIVFHSEDTLLLDITCNHVLISTVKPLKFHIFLNLSVTSFYRKDHILLLSDV